MSANRKKVLFVVVASLLASSTAVVALVAHPGTSGSTPDIVPAQLTGDVNEAEFAAGASDPFSAISPEFAGYSGAGCSASVAGECQFITLDLDSEAPLGIDFRVDTSLEHAPLADLLAAAHSAVGQSFFGDGFGAAEDRSSPGQAGGAYSLGSVQRQFQLDSLGSLSDFNSLLSLNSSASRPIGGGNAAPIPPGAAPTPPGNDTGTPPGNDAGTPPGADAGTPPGNDTGTPPGNNAPSAPGNDTPGTPCDVLTSCVPSDHTPGAPNPPIGGSDPATPVPEPGTMGLLAFGLALAAGMRRRRRA